LDSTEEKAEPSPPPTAPLLLLNENQSWQETKMTIKDRTSCLVNSERLSDILFLVGQNETPVFGHKTILSAGSPYFEKLFFGPMADTEAQIRIPDIEPEVFLSFLKVGPYGSWLMVISPCPGTRSRGEQPAGRYGSCCGRTRAARQKPYGPQPPVDKIFGP
jgi:hypothetical protein